jgi:peptidyl-prolyl cis-trans isomerase SurA
MRIATTVLSFLLLFTGLATAQKNQYVLDKIVANVGDEYIMLSDVEEQFALAKDQQATLPDNYRCLLIDNLLLQKLLIHQAKMDSLLVTEEEVESQLDARIAQILSYMNDDVAQFEEYYGTSIENVKSDFREDLTNQLLADRMRAQILENVTVTPSEIKTFFSNIPKDSLPFFNSEVEVREIVFVPKPNAVEKQKAFTLLNDLRRQIIEESKDFGELAKKYSEDYGSGKLNGDLGWAKRGKFVPEFEAASYKLEENEISPVIETEFGYHIIQMLERRGNSIHLRHILIKPKITNEDLQLAQLKLDSVRTAILTDSLPFSKAVKLYSDKNTESFNNDGLLINPQTGSAIFETSELDPDIYFAVDRLKPGEITAPIEFSMFDNSKAYRLLMLQSKTAPHKANLKQDYNKIQLATLEQKKNIYIIKWVTEKAKDTYINISPLYDTCPNLDKWVIGLK